MKLVIMDWGGVIESHNGMYTNVRHGWHNLLTRYGAEPLEEEVLIKKLDESKENIEVSSNVTEISKWKERLEKNFGIQMGKTEEFEKAYNEEMGRIFYYSDIVEYIHSLKGRCQLGIASNLNKLDFKRLDKQVDLSQFDYVWLSYALQMGKPEKRLYRHIENVAKVEGKNILLVDDTEKNIKAAAALGWNVCLLEEGNLKQLKTEVENFLKEE